MNQQNAECRMVSTGYGTQIPHSAFRILHSSLQAILLCIVSQLCLADDLVFQPDATAQRFIATDSPRVIALELKEEASVYSPAVRLKHVIRCSQADATALEKQMRLAEAVAPVAQTSEPVKYGRRSANDVTILGTTEQYQFTGGLNLAAGRFISQAECDGGRPVCVIGYEVATNLFQNGQPVGQEVAINERAFEVVGVLGKHGGFAGDNGADNQIIVPLAEFRVSTELVVAALLVMLPPPPVPSASEATCWLHPARSSVAPEETTSGVATGRSLVLLGVETEAVPTTSSSA